MRIEILLQYSLTSPNNISHSNHVGRCTTGKTKSTELRRVSYVRSEKQVKDINAKIYNSLKRHIIRYKI